MLHLDATRDRSVRTIDLPDLLDWSYQQVQQVLDREFDWIHPENQFFHCDCRLNPTLCYLEYCKHGFSEKQLIISNHLAGGDIVVWVDSDIRNIHPRFVYGLVGPLQFADRVMTPQS